MTVPFHERRTCSIGDAVEASSIGKTKLYELINAGKIATTREGCRRLVYVQSLINYLDRNVGIEAQQLQTVTSDTNKKTNNEPDCERFQANASEQRKPKKRLFPRSL